MVITLLYFIGLLCGAITAILTGAPTTATAAAILLQCFLLVSVGFTSIIAFMDMYFAEKLPPNRNLSLISANSSRSITAYSFSENPIGSIPEWLLDINHEETIYLEPAP